MNGNGNISRPARGGHTQVLCTTGHGQGTLWQTLRGRGPEGGGASVEKVWERDQRYGEYYAVGANTLSRSKLRCAQLEKSDEEFSVRTWAPEAKSFSMASMQGLLHLSPTIFDLWPLSDCGRGWYTAYNTSKLGIEQCFSMAIAIKMQAYLWK